MFDCIIVGGKIIDGTGNPWFYGDIAIRDGRIAAVRRTGRETINSWQARRTINASNCYVTPGFCDLHTSSDFTICKNNGARSSLLQGVTTECVGVCGISMYPVNKNNMSEVLEKTGLDEIPWSDLAGFREYLDDKGLGINIVPYIGHNTIRTCVMGVEGSGGERYVPDSGELEKMKTLLAQAMEQGAFGLTSGLIYLVGRNATPQEMWALCEVVKACGGVYKSHIRSEEDALIEAVDELIEAASKTGVPACVAHHKAMFKRNWGKPNETLRQIERARLKGLEVICDVYPWPAGAAYNLAVRFIPVLSKKYVEKGKQGVLEAVSSDDQWLAMKKRLDGLFSREGKENRKRTEALAPYGAVVRRARDPRYWDVVIHSPSHPEMEGCTLEEVAKAFDLDGFWDGARRLYLEDDGETRVAAGPMCEEDVAAIIESPYAAICSDAQTLDSPPGFTGSMHPRIYGNYSYALEHFVKDRKTVRLEEMIRKMTSMPASFLGIKDRGSIRAGNWADLVILDYDNFKNHADFSDPHRSPSGVEHVFVNGQLAVEHGVCTNVFAGKTVGMTD